MEIRVLSYFLTIVKTGSVTKAAEVVRVAQPSLSRQLCSLARALGMAFFDCGGKQMVLTAAGRRFLSLARDLVARADTAEAAVGAPAAGRAVRITVAASPPTITDVIVPFLAAWGPGAVVLPYRQVTIWLRGVIDNDLGAHLASRLVTSNLRAWHFSQVAADGHVSSWSSTTLPSAD